MFSIESHCFWVGRQKQKAYDVDMLVIVPDDKNARSVARTLYSNVESVGVPFDFVVMTLSQFESEKEQFWSVAYPAWKEGEVVYVA